LLTPVEMSDVQPEERSVGDAIDVVVAWVNGRDPKHRAKRKRYLADPGADTKPERAATDERRFSDNDEIRFCLRSIRNHAPWVRTIWLVTDDQVPAAIDRRRAEQHNIRIVDHREIFRGNEQLLPTFNSLAIETMLWRIEGLADRFLYFNDDMMLVGPVEPTDFFSNDGKVNLRGRWNNWKQQPPRRGSASTAATSCSAPKCWATPPSISLVAPTQFFRSCGRQWRNCSSSSSLPSLPTRRIASAVGSSSGPSRPTIICC
jgi:hypothetical protein